MSVNSSNSSFILLEREIPHFCNQDLDNIMTPLNMKRFTELLVQSNYNREEAEFLRSSFTEGFDISYKGPENRCSTSNNIPFTPGDKYEM